MTARPPAEPDRELLPSVDAKRILQRASELDANSAALGELREAAREAGISPAAFEAALEEYRGKAQVARAEPAVTHSRGRYRRMALAVAFMLSGMLVFFLMRVVPSRVSAVDPFQTQITLGCTSGDAAVEIARGVLNSQTSTISVRGSTLTVSAPTQADLDRVRELIAQRERANGCLLPTPPPAQPPR